MVLSYQAALLAPMLAIKQERVAIERWQAEGDRDSLELLVRSHERLAWMQAANWTRNPTHLEDLVVEGIMGIMQAADNFNLKFKVRFSTYAMWWISASISAAIARIKVVIDIPNRTYLEARKGRLEDERTVYARIAITGGVSLDAALKDVGKNLSSALQCSDLNPEESVIAKSSSKRLSDILYSALDVLNPTERKIIKRLKLKSKPDCVRKLAAELKMSQTKLRQVERHALMRLRRELPKRGFHCEMLN